MAQFESVSQQKLMLFSGILTIAMHFATPSFALRMVSRSRQHKRIVLSSPISVIPVVFIHTR